MIMGYLCVEGQTLTDAIIENKGMEKGLKTVSRAGTVLPLSCSSIPLFFFISSK
jgi:hypothetical protein